MPLELYKLVENSSDIGILPGASPGMNIFSKFLIARRVMNQHSHVNKEMVKKNKKMMEFSKIVRPPPPTFWKGIKSDSLFLPPAPQN